MDSWPYRTSALVVLALHGFALAASPRPQYTIMRIPPVPGGVWSAASGINDRGEVVGISHAGGFIESGFHWADGTTGQLGPLPNGRHSTSCGISESGVAVGSSESLLPWHAIIGVRTPSGTWEINDLGTLNGNPFYHSFGAAVADVEGTTVVVGHAEAGPYIYHAFRWRNGRMQDLGTVRGGADSEARDVNRDGLIVGGSMVQGWGSWVPFVYREEWDPAMRELWLGPDFHEGIAKAINDHGDIVGHALHVQGTAHALLWQHDLVDWRLRDLGTLDNEHTHPEAINNNGQIVGWTWEPAGRGRAFLWTGGQWYDLAEQLPPDSPWRSLASAEDINNQGQIVGWGDHEVFGGSAFILTPTSLDLGRPDLAGGGDALTLVGGTPGEMIDLFFGVAGGETRLDGCRTVTLDIADAQILASAVVDHAGVAAIDPSDRGLPAGGTILVQARASASCRVSNVQVLRIP